MSLMAMKKFLINTLEYMFMLVFAAQEVFEINRSCMIQVSLNTDAQTDQHQLPAMMKTNAIATVVVGQSYS